MPQLTSPPTDSRAATQAELTLCVCGTAQNGRLVRLRGANCTVGSDSQCTLRLRAAGVSPLHCLILRGDERTLVRSLSGVTRINGREISEANLEVGDRLTIGTIEFEVVDSPAGDAGPNGSIAENRPAAPIEREPAPQPNIDSLISKRQETARQGRARARRLLVQLRELRRDSELNNLRLSRLEESSDRLGRELAEAESERQRLSDEQSRLSSAASTDDEHRRQLEDQRKTVDQERVTLEQERGSLDQMRAAIEEERRSFDQARGNFDQERAALEQERGALEQVRVAIQQERDSFGQEKSRFDQQRSSLEQAKQQIEQEWFTLSQAKQQIEQERDAAAQARAAIEQQQAALQQERGAVESQQKLVQQELRTFEEHKHALTAERLDWQSEASRAEADLAGRREELDRRAGAIDKQHSDQEAARRRVEESQKALAKRQETLQQAENDLLQRKRQEQEQEQALLTARKALELDRAQLDADRRALAAAQATLAGQQQEIVELRESDQASEDEWSRNLAEQARQLTEATERLKLVTKDLGFQQSLVEAVRQELDEERQQWEAERARLQFDYEQQSAAVQPAVSQPDVQSEPNPSVERAPAQATLPGLTDSEPQAGISERQQLAVTNADEDSEVVTAVSDDVDANQEPAIIDEEIVTCHGTQPQEELSFLQSDAASEPSLDASTGTAGDAEEESIDDYMTRLLKRVQNIGQRHRPATGKAAPAPASQPTAAPEQAGQGASAPAGEGSAVQEVLAKLSRRAAAPELSSDIAAMRELANLSARAAIDTYAYRNWGRAAFGKLTIAILAAAAGVGAVHFAAAPDSMLMYAGLLSFVIALFWLLQAGILIKNVFQASQRQARMAHAINDKPHEPDAPAAEHSRDAEELPPAEIISVRDSEDCDYASEVASRGQTDDRA